MSRKLALRRGKGVHAAKLLRVWVAVSAATNHGHICMRTGHCAITWVVGGHSDTLIGFTA